MFNKINHEKKTSKRERTRAPFLEPRTIHLSQKIDANSKLAKNILLIPVPSYDKMKSRRIYL